MSTSQPSGPPEGSNPIAKIATELALRRKPGGMSSQAEAAFYELQDEFMEELGKEAIRLADRQKADQISEENVRRADMRLRGQKPGTRVGKLLEAIGGVLAGVGGSQVVAFMSGKTTPAAAPYVVAVVLLVIGVICLAVGLTREFLDGD